MRTMGAYRTSGVAATSCGIYVDGVPLALTTDATDEALWGFNGEPGFGLGYAINGWTDADVLACMVWDRILTDSEFAALHADPWRLYRRPDPIELWAAAAAGGAPPGNRRRRMILLGGSA